ncbi:MAG: Ca2+-binding RTX toxin-like protein [Verrucomicrobiales bacterium]|jgi:Ca2+-binding RTX toxin-like protein
MPHCVSKHYRNIAYCGEVTGVWDMSRIRIVGVLAVALLFVSVLSIAPARAASGDLTITEFMASNSGTLNDEDGISSDWIEIYNGGVDVLDLSGMHLTDNAGDLTKWTFPSRLLAPNSYLIVFASGNNRAGAELHTNFRLGSTGEYLALVEADGSTIATEFAPQYPAQIGDVSYGEGSGGGLRFFPAPTPGDANNAGVAGFVDDVTVSVPRGFFTTSFNVSLANTTPLSEIRYTTDGSEPTEISTLYASPISITTTTTLRASAFAIDLAPATIQTNTYIFVADVLNQPAVIPGYPNNLYDTGGGSVQHDNQMDPAIVGDPVYGPLMTDAMTAIPTMSIVADPGSIFGATGFYDGEDVELPMSLEVIYPDDPLASHQVNGGIESHSHDRLKRSLRLNFRGVYGSSNFQTDLFQRATLNGETAQPQVKRIVLRAGNNRAWTRMWNPDMTAFTEDQFYRDTQLALSGIGSHGNFVHLYINGIYWGLYNPVERPDEHFGANYFGGDNLEYYFLNHGGATDGDATRHAHLTQTLTTRDLSTPANYAELADYLDVDGYIDYLVTSFYIGLSDWPNNNWYYGDRSAASPSGSRAGQYYAWDGEWSFDVRNAGTPPNGAWVHPNFREGTSSTFEIPKIWHAVRQNDEFMTRFADRVYQHLHHSGPLTDANAQARWASINSEIQLAILGESARWGDALEPLGQPTRTRDVDWQDEVDAISAILDGNAAQLLAALRNEGFYPSIDPPVFSQRGGEIPLGTPVTLTDLSATGTIYFTTDGSDPRFAGGEIAPGATEYVGPIVLPIATTIVLRTLAPNGWSALDQGAFTLGPPTGPRCNGLTITIDIGAGDTPTAGDDVILGTPGVDVISALEGNDTICGLGGADIINAGAGDDWVDAGDGDDRVFGLGGVDTLFGGEGIDELIGFDGNDHLDGGTGADTLNGGPDDDLIIGGDDDDRIFGQGGNDTVFAGAGADLVTGSDGVDVLNGGAGDDLLNGGPGGDTVHGDAGADTIFGLIGDDMLFGDDGDDLVFGQPGLDSVDGGAGNDLLWGNEQDDVMSDPSGSNTINGGSGNDTITGGTGIDRIFGDGNLLQAGDDVLDGGPGEDLILGFAGDDTISSLDGEVDVINGGPHTTLDSCTVDPGDTVFNCSP